MTDLIDRTRPDVSHEWTPELQQETLHRLADAPPRRHHGRRWLLGAAAASAVGVVGAPALLPGWFATPAAAEELEVVARNAAGRPGYVWGAGQFLHVVTRVAYTPAIPEEPFQIDDWRDPDGWTWSKRQSRTGTEYFLFAPIWGWMRPGFAAVMPTQPHALDAFLRLRASGSTSQDEAVFEAIRGMLTQEAAPADVRAAAVRVLGLNPRVQVVMESDPARRPALSATFIDEVARPGMRQVLYLAPESGLLMANADLNNERDYRATITLREVVDGLPSEIVQRLGTERVEKDGSGTTTPYTPMPDPTPNPSQDYTPGRAPGR